MQADRVRSVAISSSASLLFLRALTSFEDITDDDRELVATRVTRTREFPSGVQLPKDRLGQSTVVVSGWIGRMRMLADGRRQVVSTVLPGELGGAYANPLVQEMNTVSLTNVRLADLAPLLEALERTPDRHERLRRALQFAGRAEEARLVEQVIRLGRRTAFERVGHWLLEIQARLHAAGLDEGDSFSMPLTQETLGDVLGLSLVHVNRIVQQLRLERLADIRGGRVRLYDADRLRMITEYGPPAVLEESDS